MLRLSGSQSSFWAPGADSGMKCLVCVLEFPTWELAKPWSFISGYSFVDALRVLGHDVEVAALTYQLDPAALTNVLRAHQRKRKTFDCIFFWFPHLEYSQEFWAVARALSRRRVAVLIESLSYTEAEIVELPHLANRRRGVISQLKHCTHALTFDYQDFRDLTRNGFASFWTPGIVPTPPTGTIIQFADKSKGLSAAGTIYGGRRTIHGELVGRGLLDPNERLQHSPSLVNQFERLISATASTCSDGEASPEELSSLGEQLLTVRRSLWYEYLRYLSQFIGVISLPAFFKGLPGRVFEAMLARCAVFVVESADLSRHKSVFENEQHLYYLSKDLTQADIDKIFRVASETSSRAEVTARALERALDQCGADVIVERVLNWVTMERTSAPSLLRRVSQRAGLLIASPPRYYSELSYEAS